VSLVPSGMGVCPEGDGVPSGMGGVQWWGLEWEGLGRQILKVLLSSHTYKKLQGCVALLSCQVGHRRALNLVCVDTVRADAMRSLNMRMPMRSLIKRMHLSMRRTDCVS
jgi:hypothetical protein